MSSLVISNQNATFSLWYPNLFLDGPAITSVLCPHQYSKLSMIDCDEQSTKAASFRTFSKSAPTKLRFVGQLVSNQHRLRQRFIFSMNFQDCFTTLTSGDQPRLFYQNVLDEKSWSRTFGTVRRSDNDDSFISQKPSISIKSWLAFVHVHHFHQGLHHVGTNSITYR